MSVLHSFNWGQSSSVNRAVSIRDVLGIAFHFEKMLYDNAVPLLAERAHVYLGRAARDARALLKDIGPRDLPQDRPSSPCPPDVDPLD
jgi:hypothetical protein